MMTAEDITENVVDSTESYEGFKNIVPELLKELYVGPKSNLRVFIKVATTILTSDDESPSNKFYGLYLLLKACESNPSQVFLDEFSSKEDLITNIFQTAQYDAGKKGSTSDKGKTFFSNNPSESEGLVGINYVRLAIELLVYCGTHFGTHDMTEPCYNFWLKMESLSKRFTLPTTYWFIEKAYNGKEEVANWDFNNKPLAFTPTQTPNSKLNQSAAGSKLNSSVVSSQSDLRVLVSEQQPILKPSPSQQASLSRIPSGAQYRATSTTPKATALDKLNESKPRSRNDLSNMSGNMTSSIFEDRSIDSKKTLGMRMAEMGMFTEEKRDRSKSRSRSPTPTAAGKRDKTPEKTQDIRNFFSEREKAAQQSKAPAMKSWQTIEPVNDYKNDILVQASKEQGISGPSTRHQPQSGAPMVNDPFMKAAPETRGREKQNPYAAVLNDESGKSPRGLRAEPNIQRIGDAGRTQRSTTPTKGSQPQGFDYGGTGISNDERGRMTGHTRTESNVQRMGDTGRATGPRPLTPTRGQPGFDFNNTEAKNFGAPDVGNEFKEKHRIAMLENENIKKENAMLRAEMERYKKELYAKNISEENLMKENRNLRAEVTSKSHLDQRGDNTDKLLKENQLLKSRFAEYEHRIAEMNNSLTYLANENKNLKEALEEKERELEDSNVPVRHVVYPGGNPFNQQQQQQQQMSANVPKNITADLSMSMMSANESFHQPRSLLYDTASQLDSYKPSQYFGGYSGDTGRRTPEGRAPEGGMYYGGIGEQNAQREKKNIFERVNYDKPHTVLSKDNPYHY